MFSKKQVEWMWYRQSFVSVQNNTEQQDRPTTWKVMRLSLHEGDFEFSLPVLKRSVSQSWYAFPTIVAESCIVCFPIKEKQSNTRQTRGPLGITTSTGLWHWKMIRRTCNLSPLIWMHHLHWTDEPQQPCLRGYRYRYR